MLLQIQNPTPNQEPALKDNLQSLGRFIQNPATLTPEVEQNLRRVFTIFEALIKKDPYIFDSEYLTVAKKFGRVSFLATFEKTVFVAYILRRLK
jgi:hypothetical protein